VRRKEGGKDGRTDGRTDGRKEGWNDGSKEGVPKGRGKWTEGTKKEGIVEERNTGRKVKK
jgi:hypothetical protein